MESISKKKLVINKPDHESLDRCNVCQSENIETKQLKVLRNDYRMGVCKLCSFTFSQPRPSQAILVDYYNSISSVRFYKQGDKSAVKDTKKLFNLIKKNHPEAKNILEVGCSTGYYLKGLKLRGFEVCGSELSEIAAKLANEWYGVDVFAAEFPPSSHYRKYDAVIIHHVIEHVIDPKDFLERASEYLRENGILILETPNVKSLGIKIFKTNYPVFCPPGHLNFFSTDTLEKALPEGHTPLISRTASENGYVIYNCINGFLSAVNLKSTIQKSISKDVAIESESETKVLNNKKYSYLKFFYKFSKITQTVLYPIFYLIDKAGWGENVSIVSQIKRNNSLPN